MIATKSYIIYCKIQKEAAKFRWLEISQFSFYNFKTMKQTLIYKINNDMITVNSR